MSKCDKCDYPNPECQKCVEELRAEYTCFKNDTEQRLAKAERLLDAADEEKAKLCAELEDTKKKLNDCIGDRVRLERESTQMLAWLEQAKKEIEILKMFKQEMVNTGRRIIEKRRAR